MCMCREDPECARRNDFRHWKSFQCLKFHFSFAWKLVRLCSMLHYMSNGCYSKWPVVDLALLQSWALHSTVLPFTHSHTHSYSASMCTTFAITNHWCTAGTTVRGHFRVQYLAQGHLGRNGGDWDGTANLLNRRRPTLPPQPQPRLLKHNELH